MGWAEQQVCVREMWHEKARKWRSVWCGVVWVKRSTMTWCGHTERMENEEFVKKVHQSSVEGPNRRGRPLGRWKDKVKEYVSERGVRGNGLEWARRVYG